LSKAYIRKISENLKGKGVYGASAVKLVIVICIKIHININYKGFENICPVEGHPGILYDSLRGGRT
jgi:hypothetical protein